MQRLDEIVAEVLAGVRRTMDRKSGAAVDAAPKSQRGGVRRLAEGDKGDRLSPRTTVRRGSHPGQAGRSLELE